MFLKKGLWILLAVLLLFVCGTALADSGITFSPENPRMGDYVDIVVHPGREGVQSVSYRLETPAGTVFDGSAKSKDHPKPETHLSVSFRPREEAVYTLTVTLVYGKRDEETVSVTIPVSGRRRSRKGLTWSTARRTAGGPARSIPRRTTGMSRRPAVPSSLSATPCSVWDTPGRP